MADAKKTAFIRDLVRRMQELDSLLDDAQNIEEEYWDLTYNSGGANAIVDADVAAYALTAADITNAITVIGRLKAMADGTAVTTADNQAVTNVFKRAPV